MNINELHNFSVGDAVRFNAVLNPRLFDTSGYLHRDVKDALLEIASDFMEHLGVNGVDIVDIVITGSNAAYTYTPHSDIDLHIVVDIGKLRHDAVYRELFNSKKVIYNDKHDIKVKGYDVELYVEDVAEPAKSAGEYSVLKNRWNRYPGKVKSGLDELSAKNKFSKLIQLSELALRSGDIDTVNSLLTTIRKYRQAGLDGHGEFGPENIAFKALRSTGVITKLYDHYADLHSKKLSLREVGVSTEDYHPNSTPPGPEFKPTMPSGTVRVDVSDVYDWYKLGQHISNLGGLGKHDFGKGPPSTILSFGDEDLEHQYIQDLMKTGLTTTDVDPPGHKKIRGQRVDPTYNVGESSGYIPSEREKNDPRWKTALTVDVKPDSTQQNAKKLGLGKIKRAGIPPTARASGKI